MSSRFSVNSAKVVHETIEGEAILIDLETGCYYSVDGAGAEMWGLLAAGHSIDDVAEAVTSRYAVDEATAVAETRRLARELETEELLEAADGGANGGLTGAAGTEVGQVSDDGTGLEFSAPVLQKYTDMQDFLLVDPIHQTTDAGWPEARSNA